MPPSPASVVPKRAVARAVFHEARRVAESSRPLPDEWLERVRKVGEMRIRTFIPLVGTALLAKATEPLVDPLTIYTKAEPTDGLRSYSARGVAGVLVELARANRVHLGLLSPEPLQNHPVIGSIRAEEIPDRVNAPDRDSAAYVVESLERIRELKTRDDRISALAAFIRVRQQVPLDTGDAEAEVSLPSALNEFVERTSAFVQQDPEGGRRGQALVEAALGMVWEHVRSGAVNDPSRTWPGDVLVLSSARAKSPFLSVEVRQRRVRQHDVHGFASRLQRVGLDRGAVVAIAKGQPRLATPELQRDVLERHGVLVRVYDDPGAFLMDAVAWSALTAREFINGFPSAMLESLRHLQAGSASLEQWAVLFADE